MIQQSEDGQKWTVRLVTNGAQMGCAKMVFKREGFPVLAESIHSHPAAVRLTVSAQDAHLLAGIACGERLAVMPYWFSDKDAALGPGYLVIPARKQAPPRLLYQAGPKAKEIHVGDLDGELPVPDDTDSGNPVGQSGVVFAPLAKATELPTPRRRCQRF